MRTLIVKKDDLTSTETFILRHAKDLPGQKLLVHGQPPRTKEGEILEVSGLERVAQRLARKLRWSSDSALNDRRYVRVLRDFEPDVVLAEFGPSGVAVHAACNRLRIPLVCFFHGYDLHVREVRDAMKDGYRRLFRDAAAIVCGARTMRDLLLEMGSPAERTFVRESSGIDTGMFAASGKGDGGVRFVHVGRFVDKKAPHLTLLAFSRVVAEEPNARLEMVGEGRLLGACIDMAVALGIEGSVTFHGPLPHDRVVDILDGARAFVQHSVVARNGDSEGTALAVLEAGACGIPAVVTRHAGFNDTVVDGVNGFLVDERDIDQMAERMRILAKEPYRAAEMGREARQRVEHFFHHGKSMRRLDAVLEWAAGRRDERPAIFPAWARPQRIEAGDAATAATTPSWSPKGR